MNMVQGFFCFLGHGGENFGLDYVSLIFYVSSANVAKTLVWIMFPCLNMAYYYVNVLFMLASAAGLLVKIDHNTLKAFHGKFVRVCVEIDLNKPVGGKSLCGGKMV